MGNYNEEAFISYVIDNILTTKEAIAYLDIKTTEFFQSVKQRKIQVYKISRGR